MPDEGFPIRGKRLFGHLVMETPRETCRGCGRPKPAGFRNFCPSCGKYPSETMVEREHQEEPA